MMKHFQRHYWKHRKGLREEVLEQFNKNFKRKGIDKELQEQSAGFLLRRRAS